MGNCEHLRPREAGIDIRQTIKEKKKDIIKELPSRNILPPTLTGKATVYKQRANTTLTSTDNIT